jgi:calpain-15
MKPFLEKAYGKSHGCYQAISGGHIAEAFLDLTGAPTLVYTFDANDFRPRTFWSKLLVYRKQQLPMGCATSSSAAGIIGMHAYSILDVREIRNVGVEFFKDKLLTGSLGNVSGFTEYDGTVRLLRIRNPHGKGEWKGEWSDRSDIWEKLLEHDHSGISGLQRSMRNDGTFWIDYDSFLMGFSNVDVSNDQSLRFDSIRSLVWLCFQAGFRVKSITDVWHF